MIQVAQRILTQRSWNRDLAQIVPQDLDTEISHKCAYRILIQWAKRSCYRDLAQVLLQDPDTSGPKAHAHKILKQRSCTSCLTGSWYRDLAQVVLEDPDTSGSKASWYEILCKWSYRILIQVVRILIQRSCYKCRADLLSLLVGVRSHTLFGVSCRDNWYLNQVFGRWKHPLNHQKPGFWY